MCVEPESNQPSSVSVSFFKRSAAAVRAAQALRDKLHGLALKPDVRAVLAEQGGDVGDGLRGADGLAAVLAVEHRDRQAQRRWREMHQSARSRIMATMRSLPHAGSHLTLSQGGDGLVLEGLDGAEPLRVARKMIGLLQRQQCG